MHPAVAELQSSDDSVRIAALHAVTVESMQQTDIRADVRIALSSPSAAVRSAAIRCWQRTHSGPDDDVRPACSTAIARCELRH